jgi:hypothetical protein
MSCEQTQRLTSAVLRGSDGLGMRPAAECIVFLAVEYVPVGAPLPFGLSVPAALLDASQPAPTSSSSSTPTPNGALLNSSQAPPTPPATFAKAAPPHETELPPLSQLPTHGRVPSVPAPSADFVAPSSASGAAGMDGWGTAGGLASVDVGGLAELGGVGTDSFAPEEGRADSEDASLFLSINLDQLSEVGGLVL